MNDNQDPLSIEQRERIDAIADEFECLLRLGQNRPIEEFIGEHPDLMPYLLRELVAIDLEHRSDPVLSDYQRRFPGDPALAEFLQKNFGHVGKTTAGDEDHDAPQWIDNYKILQPIGRGGMGQVFMAEQQTPVKRRVAVKVIKSDHPTKEILARFEAERQALALMDHQNIAKVLDCGSTPDGRPYFAMELVKGIPITDYCDRNRLSTEQRLLLFVQACRAIQHSHQKGVAHRDIKPSNILVTHYDGEPVVKVIDFGLAKAVFEQTKLTDRTLFTRFGQVVGTLEYMSPEQAEFNALDVDSRTDVYSLGVVLYELLTGSTPIGKERLKSEALDRILYLIREEEAPRPSTRLSKSADRGAGISQQRQTNPSRLSSVLRGELDWIAVKALEKDRTRRYATAAALAEDICRFLRDDPIDARPPSATYRLKKAVRKNTTAFAFGALFFLLLIAGLISTTTFWIRALRSEMLYANEAVKSKVSELEATRAKEHAIEAEQKATDSAEKLKKRLANHNATLVANAITFGDFHEARGLFEEHFGSESPRELPDAAQLAKRILYPGTNTAFHGASLSEYSTRYKAINEINAYANLLRYSTSVHHEELRWWSPKHQIVVVPKNDTIDVVKVENASVRKAIENANRMSWKQPEKSMFERRLEMEALEFETKKIAPKKESQFQNPFEKEMGDVESSDSSGPERRKPRFVSFSPDGQSVAIVYPVGPSRDHETYDIHLFDLRSKRKIWEVNKNKVDSLNHLGSYVAISANHTYNGDRVELLHPANGRMVYEVEKYEETDTLGLAFTEAMCLVGKNTLVGLLNTGQVWQAPLKGDEVRRVIKQEIVAGDFLHEYAGTQLRARYFMSLSPTGRYCASSHGGMISVHDLDENKRIHTFFAGYTPTFMIAWSSNENAFLTVNQHGVREWSLDGLSKEGVFALDAEYDDYSWHDFRAADALRFYQLNLDAGTGTKQDVAAHQDGSEHLLIRNDEAGLCISATREYQELRLRDAKSLAPIHSVQFNEAPVIGVGLANQSETLVVFQANCRLSCLTLGGEEIWSHQFDRAERAGFFVYLESENVVAIEIGGKTLMGVDGGTGDILWSLETEKSVMPTGDGSHILLHDQEERFNDFDPVRMKRKFTLVDLVDGESSAILDPVALLLWSQPPNDDQTIRSNRAEVFANWRLRIDVAAATVSSDNRQLAISYSSGIGVLWDLPNEEHQCVLHDIAADGCFLCFSPNGSTVVFHVDDQLCFYDATTGESSGRLKYVGRRYGNLFRDLTKSTRKSKNRIIRYDEDGILTIGIPLENTLDSLAIHVPPVSSERNHDVLRMKPPRMTIRFDGEGRSRAIGRQNRLLQSVAY